MAAPSVPILDDFNRANQDPIAGNWSKNGNSTAAFKIISNKVADNATNFTGMFWNVGQFNSEVDAFLTLDTLPGSGDFIGLLWGLVGTAGSATWSGYYAFYSGTSGNIGVQAINNPTPTSLATFTPSPAIVAGDKLWVRYRGGVIEVWYFHGGSWILAGNVSDTTYQRDGFVGSRGSGTAFRIDDFGGGNLVDAVVVPVALGISGTEVVGIGSAGTADFKLTPSGVEFLGRDEGTLDFKLTPSMVEVKDTNDVGERYLDLQPSGVEGPQYELIEVATVPVKFTPSGTDVKAKDYTDTVSTLLKLSATGLEVYCKFSPNLQISEVRNRFSVEARSRLSVLEDIHWEFVVLEGVDPCLPPVEAFLT